MTTKEKEIAEKERQAEEDAGVEAARVNGLEWLDSGAYSPLVAAQDQSVEEVADLEDSTIAAVIRQKLYRPFKKPLLQATKLKRQNDAHEARMAEWAEQAQISQPESARRVKRETNNETPVVTIAHEQTTQKLTEVK